MNNWAIQAIGFGGLLFAIISFQKKDRKGILFFQILASSAYFFHFLFLGAATGSIMNILGAIRNYIFYNKDKSWANKIFWLYFFIAIYIVCALFTWKNSYSALPLIGMIAGTISFWMKNPKYIRLVILISPPCWFIYNLVSGSIPGMITEVFSIASVIIGIIRLDIQGSSGKQ